MLGLQCRWPSPTTSTSYCFIPLLWLLSTRKTHYRERKNSSPSQPSSLLSSHPRRSPRSLISTAAAPIPLLLRTYLSIACPSGEAQRRADCVALCDSGPLFAEYFFLFFAADWCSSFAQYRPSANPPHTKSRKWLQVHFLKGTVTSSRVMDDGEALVTTCWFILLILFWNKYLIYNMLPYIYSIINNIQKLKYACWVRV